MQVLRNLLAFYLLLAVVSASNDDLPQPSSDRQERKADLQSSLLNPRLRISFVNADDLVDESEEIEVPTGRFGFSQLMNPQVSVKTITTTSTSIVGVTCTLSTTACVGRRRRQVLSDLFEESQFVLTPSPVKQIETTTAVAPIEDDKRDKREADPQFYLLPQHRMNMAYSPSYNYASDKLEPSRPLFVGSSDQGFGDNNSRGMMQLSEQLKSVLGRQRPGHGHPRTITFTKTNVVVSLTTFSSYVSCSYYTPILQCPRSPKY